MNENTSVGTKNSLPKPWQKLPEAPERLAWFCFLARETSTNSLATQAAPGH